MPCKIKDRWARAAEENARCAQVFLVRLARRTVPLRALCPKPSGLDLGHALSSASVTRKNTHAGGLVEL